MQALPPEILTEIFSYFKRLSRFNCYSISECECGIKRREPTSSLYIISNVCRKFEQIVNQYMCSKQCALQQGFEDFRYCYDISPSRKIKIIKESIFVESRNKPGQFDCVKNPWVMFEKSMEIAPIKLWFYSRDEFLAGKLCKCCKCCHFQNQETHITTNVEKSKSEK